MTPVRPAGLKPGVFKLTAPAGHDEVIEPMGSFHRSQGGRVHIFQPIELGATDELKVEGPHEILGTMPDRPPEVHQLLVDIVEDLDLARRLAEQDPACSSEHLDLALVGRDHLDYPVPHLVFPTDPFYWAVQLFVLM